MSVELGGFRGRCGRLSQHTPPPWSHSSSSSSVGNGNPARRARCLPMDGWAYQRRRRYCRGTRSASTPSLPPSRVASIQVDLCLLLPLSLFPFERRLRRGCGGSGCAGQVELQSLADQVRQQSWGAGDGCSSCPTVRGRECDAQDAGAEGNYSSYFQVQQKNDVDNAAAASSVAFCLPAPLE